MMLLKFSENYQSKRGILLKKIKLFIRAKGFNVSLFRLFIFLLFLVCAASQTISAQVNTQTPESENYLTVDNNADQIICDENGVCLLPDSMLNPPLLEADNDLFQSASYATPYPGKINILKYIVFAFIGGLLLNLMPCVFPLIAVKALSLTLQANDDKKKILFSSLSYGAGIIVSLVIIALALIIIKASGNFAGWGFQMQNPKFAMFLATAMLIFSLSMLDVLPITFPSFTGTNAADEKLHHTTGTNSSSVKGYAGHFLTGIFAVLIAAPCTAPLLGSAVTFALSANAIVIITFFIFIGAGFASPFVLFGFYPKLLRKLPKPGKWNLILKEIIGLILLGVVIHLISHILEKYPEVIENILYFLFITALIVWGYGKVIYSGISAKIKIVWGFVSIIIIICSWLFLVDFTGKDNEAEKYQKPELEQRYMQEFSLERLARLNSQNMPVFVNIYADWCTTCKINNALIFSSKEIEDFFAENGITMLKGDFTEFNSEIAQWMSDFRRTGVPVYAYYHSAKDYSNPLFFPEILTAQTIIKKISDTYLK